MRTKVVSREPNGSATHMLVLEHGEEVMGALLDHAVEHGITAARFTGLGAVSSSVIAFFHRDRREYEDIPIDEQLEVLSLIGNVSMFDGAPRIHAHVVLGGPDGSTRGGHLMSALVWPSLEITLDVHLEPMYRELDEESGLPLLVP